MKYLVALIGYTMIKSIIQKSHDPLIMSSNAHIYHDAQYLFLSLPLHVLMWDCLSDHCMDHMIMCISKVGPFLLINYKILTSAMLHRSQILL